MEVSFELLRQIAFGYVGGAIFTFCIALLLLVLINEETPNELTMTESIIAQQTKFRRLVFVSGVYATFWPLVTPFFVLAWFLYATQYVVKLVFGILWGALTPK